MKSLSIVSFLLLGTVVLHLFSSAAGGMIRGGGSFEGYTKKFCLPTPGASDAELQRNLDWACNQDVDCGPILPGSACAEPFTVKSRAAFAMNAYFRSKGSEESACDFQGTGLITANDPNFMDHTAKLALPDQRSLNYSHHVSMAH
ncbi:hypothetical protein F3Y22_tig00112114pilonHSYRG00228 [Hibiscus syriacus]|uniref:X8 domain-containing protein n=1 Tax=Hibiscus syriacus TaxID=106335 RepID=A0A6A2YCI5_HIBSY|nr:hypothetical protein F3Y22_tig00112114pilonHSYRG00228 [Hibiscus syriacus]